MLNWRSWLGAKRARSTPDPKPTPETPDPTYAWARGEDDHEVLRTRLSRREAAKSAYDAGGPITPGDPLYDHFMTVLTTGKMAILEITDDDGEPN